MQMVSVVEAFVAALRAWLQLFTAASGVATTLNGAQWRRATHNSFVEKVLAERLLRRCSVSWRLARMAQGGEALVILEFYIFL
jgi:hypothetical protein